MHWPFCREPFPSGQVTPTGLHMHPNLRWGASPDGIVTTPQGETGLLEVKCFFRCRGSGEVPQVGGRPATPRCSSTAALRPPSLRSLPEHWACSCRLCASPWTLASPNKPRPHPTQVDECPPGFYDQIQGQLEIMEMAWCDLILFTPARKGAAPGRNSCVLRVPRNECAYGPRLEPWTNPGAVPA